MKKLHAAGIAIILLVAGFAAGVYLGGGSRGAGEPAGQNEPGDRRSGMEWTCSMHPQIRQPGPGQCPLCGMDLIPAMSGDMRSGSGNPREISLSATAVKLAGVQVAPVVRGAVPATVRMVGKVDYDETRVSVITAWMPGRIETLHVDFTGTLVKKGDRLADLYSPELLAAQSELIQSIRAADELEESGLASIRDTARATVDASRQKLRLLGLSAEQIEEIETRGAPMERLAIHSTTGGVVIDKHAVEGAYVATGSPIYTIADLSRVWVMLDAFESDLAWLSVGQPVRVSADAYPGRPFQGKISFIDPLLDPLTRTVKVRVHVPNRGGRLKPEMYVRAAVEVEPVSGSGSTLLASNGVQDRSAEPLLIPASAPLITGKRAVVYLAVPGKEGAFEGREIEIGPRVGDSYLVFNGLSEGEQVVVNGSFKIDSAMQIMARPSMMNPESKGALGGETSIEPPRRLDVPAVFVEQLDAVFTAYFETQQALSRDDLKTGHDAVSGLARAIDRIEADRLENTARDSWTGDRGHVTREAGRLVQAVDIEKAREAFGELSDAVTLIVRRYGTSGRQPVYRYHCPMAFGNTGADWLQNKQGVENPYFGSAMFACGTEEEILVAAGGSR